MTGNRSKDSLSAKGNDTIIEKYIDTISENAKVCNKYTDRYIYLFYIISAILYFFSTLKIAQIEILGTSIDVPQLLVLGVAPPVLSFLFYLFMSYNLLTGIYSAVLEHAWRTLNEGSQIRFKDFHFALLQPPHLFLFPFVMTQTKHKPILKDKSIFGRFTYIFVLIIASFMSIIPILIIIYFILKGIFLIKPLWALILSYVLSFFLIFFSFYEHYEAVKNLEKEILSPLLDDSHNST